MKLVIARYNEDISWSDGYDRIIYNKGAAIDAPYVVLPNVGREAHTYLTHIIENYDTLDEYTLFLQGWPNDHTTDVGKEIERLEKEKPEFSYISRQFIECNLSGCRHHPGLPIRQVYEYLFQTVRDDFTFEFGQGAQFMVSRNRIHRYPRLFYERALELVKYEVNPLGAYVLERLWGLIFA
jgi:Protein of unknown function (DUF3431)